MIIPYIFCHFSTFSFFSTKKNCTWGGIFRMTPSDTFSQVEPQCQIMCMITYYSLLCTFCQEVDPFALTTPSSALVPPFLSTKYSCKQTKTKKSYILVSENATFFVLLSETLPPNRLSFVYRGRKASLLRAPWDPQSFPRGAPRQVQLRGSGLAHAALPPTLSAVGTVALIRGARPPTKARRGRRGHR